MMIQKFYAAFALALVLSAGSSSVMAQDPAPREATIVDHITEGGRNVVVSSDAIMNLIVPDRTAAPEKKTTSGKIVVYKVQVFSDNKAERSRQEARRIERQIAAKFPDYSTSVDYVTPYWRLVVGSFRTSGEAEELAVKLRKAFPAYSREIHVVRARGVLPKQQ